jgi:hypothetical protein
VNCYDYACVGQWQEQGRVLLEVVVEKAEEVVVVRAKVEVEVENKVVVVARAKVEVEVENKVEAEVRAKVGVEVQTKFVVVVGVDVWEVVGVVGVMLKRIPLLNNPRISKIPNLLP